MKKGRHRRFEEARALKRGELDMDVLGVLDIDTGVGEDDEEDDAEDDRWSSYVEDED